MYRYALAQDEKDIMKIQRPSPMGRRAWMQSFRMQRNSMMKTLGNKEPEEDENDQISADSTDALLGATREQGQADAAEVKSGNFGIALPGFPKVKVITLNPKP